LQSAITLDIAHFKNLLTHFKSKADDELDISDELERFDERHLEISQLFDGNWYINGILDKASGLTVYKMLNDGADFLWRNDSEEARAGTTRSQYRADWLGAIFTGYESATIKLRNAGKQFIEFDHSSNKSCDLLVDIELLNKHISTRQHLIDMLTKNSPIRRTHSRKFIERLLCDCKINMPIRNIDGKYDVGSTIRIASAKQKRELALQQDTCAITGCSMPASYCDAHHIDHWIHGGKTKITNLVLLCSRHHMRIHADKLFAEIAGKQITELKEKIKLRTNSPP
jgi:hypothetical protein